MEVTLRIDPAEKLQRIFLKKNVTRKDFYGINIKK
jgi:hypothetical protein